MCLDNDEMQEITSLEVQKNNAERVNVYLDGEFAFGLNLMDAAALRKGQKLSEADIATLREKDATVKAFDAAVTYLSYRPRSVKEIRDKLAKKEYSELVIESVIQRLEKYGYVDDRTFAKLWIQDRNRLKPRGKMALRFELRNKGIADAIINELLDEMVDEKDGAYDAASKRIRRMQGKTQREFKKKVGAFLQRRGFSYESANQALERHIAEILEDDPDFFAQDNNRW